MEGKLRRGIEAGRTKCAAALTIRLLLLIFVFLLAGGIIIVDSQLGLLALLLLLPGRHGADGSGGGGATVICLVRLAIFRKRQAGQQDDKRGSEKQQSPPGQGHSALGSALRHDVTVARSRSATSARERGQRDPRRCIGGSWRRRRQKCERQPTCSRLPSRNLHTHKSEKPP